MQTKHPIVIGVPYARILGLNEAIVLQQLWYWLTETESGTMHEGQRWVYNSLPKWQEQFPFWSVDTVKRAFASLLKRDLIKVKQLAPSKHDRTNYYTINLPVFNALRDRINQEGDAHILPPSAETVDSSHECKLPSSKSANSTRRRVQKQPVDEGKNSQTKDARCTPLHTETTTETTPQTLPPTEVASTPVPGELVTQPQAEAFQQPDQRSRRPEDMPGPKDPTMKTYRAWTAYAHMYKQRYGVYPLWNAQAGKLLSLLVDRVGAEEAHWVAVHFVKLNNDLYVKRSHPIDLLLKDCQSIYTQMKTGTSMTSTKARQIDQTQTNLNTADEVEQRIRARHAAAAGGQHANG